MHSSELTPNRSPTSEPFSYCDYACMHKLPDKADTVNRDHFYSKFLLIQPFINQSSYQYWFWRGFIAFLVTPDHFAQAILYHMPLMSGTFCISTCTMVATVSSHAKFKLPHLHVLQPGALTKNIVQHTAVLQLLYDFTYCQRVKTGESYIFILVIYMRSSFNITDWV